MKEKLAKKYDWADSDMLLDQMPEKKQKQKKSAVRKVAESSEVQNSEEPQDSN